MNSEPLPQHLWLQRMVGNWTYESEADMGPGQPPCKSTGTEAVRSIGGLWIVCEGQGQMPDGAPATMIMSLGFDPRRGRFIGTWIGSMMTHMWVYEGELDAAQRALTLDTEGPDFAVEGKVRQYRDVIEILSDEERTLSSHMLGDDGAWHRFMTAQYRRTA